jgi:hypothetical protein
MKFGFEDVAFHAQPTPNEEQLKTLIILQDLEFSNVSKRPLETLLAEALQDQNLDRIPFSEQQNSEARKCSIPVMETPMSDSRSLFWTFSHNNSEHGPTTPGGSPEDGEL